MLDSDSNSPSETNDEHSFGSASPESTSRGPELSTLILIGLLLGIASGLFFGDYCEPLAVVGAGFVGIDAAIAGEHRPCEARQYFRGFLRQGFLLILRVCAGIDGIAGTAVGIAGGMTAVLAIAIVLAVFTVAVIVTLPHAERSIADNRLIGVGHVRAAHRQSRIRERQHSPVA